MTTSDWVILVGVGLVFLYVSGLYLGFQNWVAKQSDGQRVHRVWMWYAMSIFCVPILAVLMGAMILGKLE